MEVLWEPQTRVAYRLGACPLFVNGGWAGSIDRGLGNS
jgi:hypothetical protein